ncbi:hypothetical protein AB205_0161660 [Aquarana catesbeiana]|uniref:Uncharacterized protein n=1 Tax=Aquarana catesbeiana TaxID=8400 RepID=A0A2G9SJ59_AQUCT|nr:hypothetical protein AB205_0161660 [Aquarana catesbeiana]
MMSSIIKPTSCESRVSRTHPLEFVPKPPWFHRRTLRTAEPSPYFQSASFRAHPLLEETEYPVEPQSIDLPSIKLLTVLCNIPALGVACFKYKYIGAAEKRLAEMLVEMPSIQLLNKSY